MLSKTAAIFRRDGYEGITGPDRRRFRIYADRIQTHLGVLVQHAGSGDGRERRGVVWIANDIKPDVAILDVWMPKLDGIQAAHQIRKDNPDTAIVFISSYDDLTFVADLMQNGVERKAYLLKHPISDVTGPVSVVEAVPRGRTVLDSGIVQRLARLFCKYSQTLNTDLSDVEQDVLGLKAQGYDDERICATLHLGQSKLADYSEPLHPNLGILGGTDEERRIMAVRAFVGQIHKVPLGKVYVAVS